MRILLDESLPRRLSGELAGHSVKTVSDVGWSSVENGELLRRAAGQFDVFITADQNLQFQQNFGTLPLTVITLVARTNKLEELRPLVPCSSVWRRSRAGRLCASAASHRLRLRRGRAPAGELAHELLNRGTK